MIIGDREWIDTHYPHLDDEQKNLMLITIESEARYFEMQLRVRRRNHAADERTFGDSLYLRHNRVTQGCDEQSDHLLAIGQAGDETDAVVVPESLIAQGNIITYLLEHFPQYMMPRYVEFVDEIPKTAKH